MITPNVEERLESTVNRLRDWRTVRYEFLPVVYTDEVNDKQVLPIDFNSWKNFEKPYTIYEEDKYFWFKANFEIKRKNSHQKAYFVLDNHIDGRFVASTIRPQGLLYVNGKITQGIDINHGEVLLDDGNYEIYLLFYSHTFGRYLPMDFAIKYVDERIDGLYYDLFVPYQGMKLLDKKSNGRYNQKHDN